MSRRRSAGERAIYQRAADSRWVGSIRHEDPIAGVRKRTVVYGDTRKAVVDKLKVISRRLDDGKPARDDKVTLDAFASEWITSSLAASCRKATTKALYSGLAGTTSLAAKSAYCRSTGSNRRRWSASFSH